MKYIEFDSHRAWVQAVQEHYAGAELTVGLLGDITAWYEDEGCVAVWECKARHGWVDV